MKPSLAFFCMLYGAVCGYQVHKKGLDKKLLSALDTAWENRVRKDAQIIQSEVYKRTIQQPNAERNPA
jgi:hypothetical protein